MANPGDKIGPYTLIRKIGYGSFGVVWLAEKRTTIVTTNFALKLARHEDVEVEAFKQEAEIWVKASGHPNVLTIIEADVYDGQIVIVSEYIPDGSLKDWLRQHGGKAPSDEAAVEMALQVLSGLEHLHEQRIIHRDIKPDNILLQRGTPRLADFGIARLLKTDSYSQAVKGTLLYMAPEAFSRKRNEKTDVWSIGVVLYQMLSGCLPYDEPDLPALIGAIVSRDPSPLPESIPASLRHVVEKALKREPPDRYQSAAEMRRALLSIRGEMWQAAPQQGLKADTLEADTSIELTGPQQSSASPSGIAASPVEGNVVEPSTDQPLVKSGAETASQPDYVMPATMTATPPVLSPPAHDLPSSPYQVGIKALRRTRIRGRTILALFGVVALLILLFWGIPFWRRAAPPGPREDQIKASSPDVGKAQQSLTTPTLTSATDSIAQPTGPFRDWTFKQTIAGHGLSVNTVAFSRDSLTLASGSNDTTIKLWDALTGTLKQTLPGRRGWYVRALAFSNSMLASGNQYYAIRLWDAQAGALKKTLNGHTGTVLSVAFTLDSTTLASASCDETIKLWDVEAGKLRRTIIAQRLEVCLSGIAVSPDGSTLASAGKDIKLWDAQTGVLRQTFTGHKDGVADVAFSPDGKTLASAGCDRTIKLWDIETGQLRQTLTEHSDCVMSVTFSPDGKTLASASKDKTVRLWDAQSGTLRQTLTGHLGVVWQVTFSPDGKMLASGSDDKTVKVWQTNP